MGDEAASLLGTSPEERKRSMPSSHTMWGHDTVDEVIFPDALRRPQIEPMRAWAKNLPRRSHEAKTLLGTAPEQRKRSMPSGIREPDGSGWLRFPPLWETAVWCVLGGVMRGV